MCAFSKGRSSNFRMNQLRQQAASLQFATGIVWHVRHIETKRNPSDEPSRRFEVPKGRVSRAFCAVREDSCGLSVEASAPSKPLRPKRPYAEEIFPCGPAKFFLEVFLGVVDSHMPLVMLVYRSYPLLISFMVRSVTFVGEALNSLFLNG